MPVLAPIYSIILFYIIFKFVIGNTPLVVQLSPSLGVGGQSQSQSQMYSDVVRLYSFIIIHHPVGANNTYLQSCKTLQ